MRGGGPLILLALAGCLPPAPRPDADAPTALRPLEPMHTQETLQAAGAPALRGRLTGACAGSVRVEAGTTNQTRPLSVVTFDPGPYVLFVPTDVPIRLRWGCDADKDGTVEANAVAVAPVGALTADMALDLRVYDAAVAARFRLAEEATRAPPMPPPAGANGAPAIPAGLAPPDAPAPADAAVGPPLPEGPPPDAGPPPPSGTAPPPPP